MSRRSRRSPTGGGWQIHGRGNDQPPSGHAGRLPLHPHRRSMTAPGSSTPRSTTTNKPSPPPRSGAAPSPGSRRTASPVERVLTDNGACYRSGLWHRACADDRHHRQEDPAPPAPDQRQGRTLPPDPARGMGLHPRPGPQNRNAPAAYDGFIHFYNHHRPHGALGWATPASHPQGQPPREHN